MLALGAGRWSELRASPGGNGELARNLIREIRAGKYTDYAELYQQACHQFSVGEVAFAVVPHVIEIAAGAPLRERLWPLIIAGTVAASMKVTFNVGGTHSGRSCSGLCGCKRSCT